ncbi:MAG: class II aldolase [Rhizobium sp.]|nr:MAG: class II aldolase [Rhizobium sp.]
MAEQTLRNTVPSEIDQEEWNLRVSLAAAYRMVALFGWDDIIFTHLSARIPGPGHHFLINPYELMFEEITASSLVKIDVEGNKVDGSGYTVNQAGFVIHSALHMARPDAQAVMHLHTPYGQAVSAMAEGLLPHTQTGMIVAHDLAYHDYEGIATDLQERETLAQDLGSKNLMILRNHGTLAVGGSIAEAFMRMYFLERACEAQVHMLAAGRDGLVGPHQGMPDKVREQSTGPGMNMIYEKLAWPALMRKLDRVNPGYRS